MRLQFLQQHKPIRTGHENIKDNRFDFTKNLVFQNWETLFLCLKGPIYPELVKKFWITSKETHIQVSANVLGNNTFITESLIAKLFNLNEEGRRCCNLDGNIKRMQHINAKIFWTKKSSKFVKDL